MAKKKQRPRPKELDKDELFDLAMAAYDHMIAAQDNLTGKLDRRSVAAMNELRDAGDNLNQLTGLIYGD